MRKLLKWVGIVVIIAFVGLQFTTPARTNPPVDQSQTIEARAQVPPQVSAILDRSCRDCHTNNSVWPWYSHVAPVSWLVVGHVNDARRSMNMSEWGHLNPDRQQKKLQQICDEVTDGAMPLGSYTPLHPGSKLSADDVKTLCEWANSERQRLEKTAAK